MTLYNPWRRQRLKSLPYASRLNPADADLPIAILYFGQGAWYCVRPGQKKRCLGSAWTHGAEAGDRNIIVLPPNESPGEYNWSPLNGYIIGAYEALTSPEGYAEAIARAAIEAGVLSITFFMRDRIAQTSSGIEYGQCPSVTYQSR